jgi:hypothetical protein
MENKCLKYYKSQHNVSCTEMLSSLGYRNTSSKKIKMGFETQVHLNDTHKLISCFTANTLFHNYKNKPDNTVY